MDKLIEQFINVHPSVLEEYLKEAEHQGWEGWTESNVTTIKQFMTDVVAYDNAQ